MNGVNCSMHEGVALILLDDGKVNALGMARFEALNRALDDAEAADAAVLIAGRPGVFSAGFDLKELGSGGKAAVELLRVGARLCVRLLRYPRPVVSACTGHAYPMGAFILLSSDYRIGADGPFRIGMNEAEIGLVVPRFAIELARARLTPAAFNRTVITGAMYAPADALVAGFLDEVCPADMLIDRATEKCRHLAGLPDRVHHQIKLKLRAPLLEAMEDAIATELAADASFATRLTASD